MTRSRRPRRSLAEWLERLAAGVLPAADGGPPPAMRNARARLSWIRWSVLGFLAGGVLGILLALLILGVPSWPVAILAFGGGVLVGAALGFTLASRVPAVRAGGAAAILLAPLALVFLPFALLGGLFALLRKWPAAPEPESPAEPACPPPAADAAPPLPPPSRAARRAAPRRRGPAGPGAAPARGDPP